MRPKLVAGGKMPLTDFQKTLSFFARYVFARVVEKYAGLNVSKMRLVHIFFSRGFYLLAIFQMRLLTQTIYSSIFSIKSFQPR